MSDLERPSVDGPAVPESLDAPEEPTDDLSPSVRRLVRQYQLDITGVHGTGPSGRIRVGDVLALVGGRDPAAGDEQDDSGPEDAGLSAVRRPVGALPAPTAASAAGLSTLVFECDVSRVLNHQHRMSERGEPIRLSCYFIAACAGALVAVPALRGPADRIDIAFKGVRAHGWDAVIRDADKLSPRELDAALVAAESPDMPRADPADTTFTLCHYGLGGGVFGFPATPTGLARAALGIGKVRRVVAVKTVNGEDVPRITAQCYLGLSFASQQIDEQQATAFLAECVRKLESYSTATMESAT